MKLYSVLAAKCYLHLSVNKFKTIDKTKIPEIVPRRPLHHRSDFIYHVKREMTDKKSEVTQTTRCGRVSKRNVKAPVLTSESDINLIVWEKTHRDLPSEK